VWVRGSKQALRDFNNKHIVGSDEGPHAQRIARLFPETHRRSGFGLSLSAERLEVRDEVHPSE